MEDITFNGTNLAAFAALQVKEIQAENKQLELILKGIQSTCEPLCACVVYELFKNTTSETFVVIEAIDVLIGFVDDVALADELVQMREMLKSLLAENSNLERLFASHTYCPALDKPE